MVLWSMYVSLCILMASVVIAAGGVGEKIVEAARKQVGVTLSYDPAYVSLEYPGGDIPREKGVCTDVVIRALRDGLDEDLQKLVHEDMKANFGKYPNIWGLRGTDRSIDHRRVPNLMAFLGRKHEKFDLPDHVAEGDFKAGDIVTCTVPPNLAHVMIVSDKKDANGLPMVIHNIGGGTQEESRLGSFPLTGHFRWKE